MTITIEITKEEATFWAAKVKKDRAEVAQWKNERNRVAVLAQLDSLLAKLSPKRFDDGEVGGA